MEYIESKNSFSREDREIFIPIMEERIHTEIDRSFQEIIEHENIDYFFQKYVYIIPQEYGAWIHLQKILSKVSTVFFRVGKIQDREQYFTTLAILMSIINIPGLYGVPNYPNIQSKEHLLNAKEILWYDDIMNDMIDDMIGIIGYDLDAEYRTKEHLTRIISFSRKRAEYTLRKNTPREQTTRIKPKLVIDNEK